MIRAFGSEKRKPLSPAASSSEAMDADCSPEQILDYMRLGVLDANRPTMRDSSSVQVRDHRDPFNSTAMSLFAHVDKIVDDHTAQITKPKLATYLVGGLHIGLVRGRLGVCRHHGYVVGRRDLSGCCGGERHQHRGHHHECRYHR